MKIKDSGTRREFETGAVRDAGSGKGRFDLLPYHTIMELAKHFENGSEKYDERNWEQGIPIHCFVDSAQRHMAKYILGWKDEDHLMAAIWNLVCLRETLYWIDQGILPESLNDLPKRPEPESEY